MRTRWINPQTAHWLWQSRTKTVKHIQVLLFFGQEVSNAKQMNPILKQALIMLQLFILYHSLFVFSCFWFFASSNQS